MAERVAKGTWVELGATLLAPGERAPQVPEDARLLFDAAQRSLGLAAELELPLRPSRGYGSALILAITAFFSARSTFSIFMASTVASA